jgi:hypothetical protein
MKLRSASIFLVLALFIVGCKSGDSASTTDNSSSTAGGTTTGDTAKTADAGGTTGATADDASKDTNSVVGTWTTDAKDMTDQNVEFKDDGTATMSGTLVGVKGVTAEGAMTYKIDGDKMTEKMTSEKLTAGDDADAKTKDMVEKQNAQATPENIAKQPEQGDTIKWNGKDSFTLTSTDKDAKVTTFTRKS